LAASKKGKQVGRGWQIFSHELPNLLTSPQGGNREGNRGSLPGGLALALLQSNKIQAVTVVWGRRCSLGTFAESGQHPWKGRCGRYEELGPQVLHPVSDTWAEVLRSYPAGCKTTGNGRGDKWKMAQELSLFCESCFLILNFFFF